MGFDKIFFSMLAEYKLPKPKTEFVFHPDRNWKFDYCYPDKKIAIEKEGGIFNQKKTKKDGTTYISKGAHGSITGILRDIEKYTEAAILGYRVIRIVASDFLKWESIEKIQRAYYFKED